MAKCDCTNGSFVTDSRQNEFGTRRRRECSSCGARWSTIEIEMADFGPKVNPFYELRRMYVKKFLEQQLSNIETLDLGDE